MMAGAAAVERIRAGNHQAAYLSWDLDPDPAPYSLFHTSQAPPVGQNFGFYSNPEADKLMEAARGELDVAKRREIFWRLQQVLAEDQPYAWIIQVSAKWGVNKRVRGVASSRGIGYDRWYPGQLNWWIAPGVSRR